MNKDIIKTLEERLAKKKNTPKTMERLETNAEVQQLVELVFDGEKKVKAEDIYKSTRNSVVRDLLYNYAYNNLDLIDFTEELDSTYMSNFQLYKQDMASYPLLTRDEEYKYGRMIKDGSPKEVKEGIDALVNHNLRLVISISKRYRGTNVEFQDLVQEGNLGLMRAAEKYDVDTGNRFTTYATWWVQQSIGRYIECNDRSIRLPVHRHSVLRNLKYDKKRYIDKYCKEPTLEELAEFISKNNPSSYIPQTILSVTKTCPNIPENKRSFYNEKYKDYIPLASMNKIPRNNGKYQPKRIVSKFGKIYDLNFKKDIKKILKDACLEEIRKLENDNQGVISLNVEINSDPEDSDELIDFIADKKDSASPEVTYEKADLSRIVAEFLEDSKTNSRAKEILRLRYGLSLDGPMKEEEICAMMEVIDKKNGKIIRSKEQVASDIKNVEKLFQKFPEEAEYIYTGEKLKSKLNAYQKELIILKYGISTGEEKKLEEIGKIFNITRERVRQIENKEIETLKSNIKFKIKTKDYIK